MKPRSTDPFPDAVAGFVASVWLGMIVGVSFLPTLAKFHAASLDFAVALEVGRQTFPVFKKVEWGLATLLGIAVFFPRAPRAEIIFTATTVAIVAVQALWLLPILDSRVEGLIGGRPMPSSTHHMLYAVLEAGKVLTLAAVALVALFRLGWRDKPEIDGGNL